MGTGSHDGAAVKVAWCLEARIIGEEGDSDEVYFQVMGSMFVFESRSNRGR